MNEIGKDTLRMKERNNKGKIYPLLDTEYIYLDTNAMLGREVISCLVRFG